MGIDNITKVAVALTLAAALTGHLPRATKAIQIAQVKLLKESQASNWGSPDLLHRNANSSRGQH